MVVGEAERGCGEVRREIPDDRSRSPGLGNVERFVSVIKPEMGYSLIDIGCGTGEAGLKFRDEYMLDVSWTDATDEALHSSVPRERFIQAPLWRTWHLRNRIGWDYGFCCNVLENLPTEYVMLSLERMVCACRTVWLQISRGSEEVRPHEWWKVRLATICEIVDARDLFGSGLYIVRRGR